MTYRGPLYDQAPEELPDSPYKVLLNQTHADHQAIIAKAGTHLPAWLLHSLQVQNATILNEYERLAGEVQPSSGDRAALVAVHEGV